MRLMGALLRFGACVSCGLLLLVPPLVRADSPQATLDELTRRAAIIKPAAEECGWRRIPWLTDLAEAQRIARAERRPLFLFASAYDPLERC